MYNEIAKDISSARISGFKEKMKMENFKNVFEERLNELQYTINSEGEAVFFMDRPKYAVRALIDYTLTGRLHLPKAMCVAAFADEMKYWKISFERLERCCYHKYIKFMKHQTNARDYERMIWESDEANTYSTDKTSTKAKIWATLDRKNTSCVSRMYHCISTIFVLLAAANIYIVTLNQPPLSSPSNITSQIPIEDSASGRSVKAEDDIITLTEINGECKDCVCPLIACLQPVCNCECNYLDVLEAFGLLSGDNFTVIDIIDQQQVTPKKRKIPISYTTDSSSLDRRRRDTNNDSSIANIFDDTVSISTGFALPSPTEDSTLTSEKETAYATGKQNSTFNRLVENDTDKKYSTNETISGKPNNSESLNDNTDLKTTPQKASSLSVTTTTQTTVPPILVPMTKKIQPKIPIIDDTPDIIDTTNSTDDYINNISNATGINRLLTMTNDSLLPLFDNITVNDNITLNDSFSKKEHIFPGGEAFLDVFTNTVKNIRQKISIVPSIFKENWEAYDVIEVVTSLYFLVELIIRFYCCPNKVRFFKGILNIFDIVLVVTQMIRYILAYRYRDDPDGVYQLEYELLMYLQIFRVVRLFRIIENVTAFKVLQFSVRNGKKDLGVMLMYVIVAMVILGNFVYFVEDVEDFPSIPASFYWSIITMTTVGYGDMYPKTAIGKGIGCTGALLGLMLFALVIPMVVTTFLEVYEYADSIPNIESAHMHKEISSKKETGGIKDPNCDDHRDVNNMSRIDSKGIAEHFINTSNNIDPTASNTDVDNSLNGGATNVKTQTAFIPMEEIRK